MFFVNTKCFDNNSRKSFTEACKKVSKTLKSKLVAKFKKLDFKKSRKLNNLTKSKDDSTKINTPKAPSDSVVTTSITTTTPFVSNSVNSVKKEIAHVQKNQTVLPPLKEPLGFFKSTPQIDEGSVSSVEDINRYDSDVDSIFESPVPTAAAIFQTTANSGTTEEFGRDSASTQSILINSFPLSLPFETQLVCEKVSILETAKYVSEFFNLVENERESEEKEAVSMEYIWMKLYEILTIKSDNQQLQLFELSELEITTNLVKSITDTKQRKKQIPKNDKPHPNRFRNQKISLVSTWYPHHKLF